MPGRKGGEENCGSLKIYNDTLKNGRVLFPGINTGNIVHVNSKIPCILNLVFSTVIGFYQQNAENIGYKAKMPLYLKYITKTSPI
jgi:hypothetical protein